jgi:hypothetical protein
MAMPRRPLLSPFFPSGSGEPNVWPEAEPHMSEFFREGQRRLEKKERQDPLADLGSVLRLILQSAIHAALDAATGMRKGVQAGTRPYQQHLGSLSDRGREPGTESYHSGVLAQYRYSDFSPVSCS